MTVNYSLFLNIYYIFIYIYKNLSIAIYMCRESEQIAQLKMSARCAYGEGEKSLCLHPSCFVKPKRCSSRLNLL